MILALAYMAVVVMTMQELTLPQRLWIHRSIFGQHNRRYYNSEPFGGDKPTSASAEEREEYQRRALNEEAQALAMLVAGITLEVSITRPADTNHIGMAPNLHPRNNPSIVYITISLPKKLSETFCLSIIKTSSLQKQKILK